MIKNYFKIAWRNLSRNKGFTFINLLGLTIGITCTIFIYLWVLDELSYDKFNKNHHDIYQVMANRNFNGEIITDNDMVFPLASYLAGAYPQIKKAIAASGKEPHVLSNNADKKLNKDGLTVSPGFFDVFSFEFVYGNAAAAYKLLAVSNKQ
jgi:putative ABC transport system permease protein